MSMKNMARSGADGNMRLLSKYGAGSTPPRQSYPKNYRNGGAVTQRADGGPVASDMADIGGATSKPNLGRKGRKMAKKDGDKKGAKTNIVIAITPKDAAPQGAPSPAGAMPMPMPHPVPAPMPAPPMAGPPPGGPPMAMHAKGGRVKRADGGKVQDVRDGDEDQTGSKTEAEGAANAKIGRKSGGKVDATEHEWNNGKYKRGGKVMDGKDTHDDESGQDTKPEREAMAKFEGRKVGGKVKRADGGPVLKREFGSGSGEGRMENAKDQKKVR